MIPVKTMPRFKCDFCKKRGIKRKIEWHEKLCFRNPNRVCFECKNTGRVEVDIGMEGYPPFQQDCQYCAKFDPKFMEKLELPEEV